MWGFVIISVVGDFAGDCEHTKQKFSLSRYDRSILVGIEVVYWGIVAGVLPESPAVDARVLSVVLYRENVA